MAEDEKEEMSVDLGGFVKFMLFLIAALLCVLVVFEVNDRYGVVEEADPVHGTLVVSISDDVEDEELSDSTQIRNAVEDGGMMIIALDSDWLDENFIYGYGRYGATNSEGYYYTLGTVLNFIASEGWQLVQGPTTGLAPYYLFSR